MINVIQNGELYEITFPYDAEVITLLKNVPGRRWNPAGKMWTIPKDRLGFFINEFRGTKYEPAIRIRSDEDLNRNETLSATTVIPDIDISKIPFYVKEGSEPYQHQLDFMKWAIDRQNHGNMHGFICADEMGCISGDALIHLNFRKSYLQITLRELYQHWIARPQYHDRGNYKVRCLRDGVFRLHDVYNILYSGDKPVYKLMLSGGYSVKCTADHEILTDKGYVQLQDLEIGDNVVTNGQLACPRCGTTENICTYKEAKYYGFCRKCMYKLRDEANRTSYSEIQDADGYILCRGKDIPEWHGFTWSGYIYKHRLVMEEHLGRRLLPDEVVHHINGVRDDNRLENLELTNLHDHHRVQHDETSKLYSKDGLSRWGNRLIIVPKYQTVQSIEYVGVEDTYDIKMYDPYHNFLADGVVVHNCGKSVEAANLAWYNKKQYGFKHCLIICCVNSAKYNWQDDIQAHLKEHAYILGTRLRRDGTEKCDTGSKEKLEDLESGHMYGKAAAAELPYFLIVNIEAFRYRTGRSHPFTDKIIQMILNCELSMIVIDEVHRNASPQSDQGKQLLKIKKETGSAAMWIPMTGTPITKQPMDVFTPLRLCNGHDFTSYYKWCQHFCVYGGFGDYEIVGHRNIPELKKLLETNMIRRLKADVLDLPPKIRYTEYVENSEYQRKLYKQVLGDVIAHRTTIVTSLNPMAQLLRLRQVNGSPELIDKDLVVDDSYVKKNAKLQRLLELIADIVARDEKVVVFSNWVEPLRTLYKFISKHYGTCVFTGTMSLADREKHKKAFQTNPEYKVLLGTIGAAGTVQTFTAARNVIFFDDPWNPSDKEQAEDRCLVAGTKITTPSGFINIEDIKVGDEVFTHTGAVQVVTDVWSHEECTELVEIQFYGNPQPITLTSDHKVLTVNGWKSAGQLRSAADDLMCEDITPSMPIATDELNITHVDTGFNYDRDMYFINSFGVRQLNGRKHPIPEHIELTSEFLFFCGYYLGDGCACNVFDSSGGQIQLAGNPTTKYDSLLRCRDWFVSTITGAATLRTESSTSCILYLNNKLFNNFMATEFGRSHIEKRFPEWVFSLNYSQLHSFYEGLCASDGYFDTRASGTTQQWYTTVTPALAAGVWWLMSRLGYKPRIEHRQPTVKTHKAYYNIQHTIDPTYKLKTGRIRSIRKYVDRCKLYDITVANDNSFYSWGTPLHNCYRIGTTQSVNIFTLVAKDTVDDRVEQILAMKSGIAKYIVDGKIDLRNNPELFDFLLGE